MAVRKTTAVAKKKKSNSALIVPDYGNQAGKGWEGTDGSDFQIPFLNLLQSNSPQCDEDEDAYMKEAKAGMFFNSVTQELYTGDVVIIPVLTAHSFVEWKDQDSGGGFVGEHGVNSDVVQAARDEAEDALSLTTPAGNDLTETYQMFALVLKDADAEEYDQVVISFSRTKIKRYKQIMTRLRTFKGSDRIPLFAHRLLVSATTETSAAGKKYKNIQLNPAVDNDIAASLIQPDGDQSPLMEVAEALMTAVQGGAARVNYDSAEKGSKSGKGKDEAADEVFS